MKPFTETIRVPMEGDTRPLAALQRELESQGRYIASLEVRKGFWLCTVLPKRVRPGHQPDLFGNRQQPAERAALAPAPSSPSAHQMRRAGQPDAKTTPLERPPGGKESFSPAPCAARFRTGAVFAYEIRFFGN